MRTEKCVRIIIRTTDAEKRGFNQAAQLAGMNLSAWIRDRLRRAAVRELSEVGELAPFIKHVGMIR